jgi:hypothetical protein
MKRILLSATAIGLAALGLFAADPAGAYVLLSPNRVWGTTPVAIEVSNIRDETSIGAPDLDYGQTATANALNSAIGWNGAVPGLVNAFTTSNDYALGDGTATIVFNDPLSICTGSCIAATLSGYYHFDGGLGIYLVDDADVFATKKSSIKFDSEIEKPPGTCSAAFFVEGIMMHEVGHVLGLGHSAVSTATMYSTVAKCDAGLDEIATDDATGINVLY